MAIRPRKIPGLKGKALPRSGSDPFLLFEKGMRLQAHGRIDAATQCYNELIAFAPDHVEALCMRAQIHLGKKRYKDAIADLQRARKSRPDNPQLGYFIAYQLYQMKRPFEALRILRRTLDKKPGFAIARLLKARIHAEIGRHEEGRQCLAGSGIDFSDPLEKLTYFNVLLRLACNSEAEEVLLELIRSKQHLPECLYELTRLPGERWNAEHKQMIARLLADSNLSKNDRIALHFASGRIAESEHRFDQAIAHFSAANDSQPSKFDINAYRKTLGRIQLIFDKSFFADRQDFGDPVSGPVFIVGMPRSGKTLVEGVLAKHSNVCAGGEIPMQQIVESSYFIELDGKLPISYSSRVTKLTRKKSKQLAKNYMEEIKKYSSGETFITNTFPHNFQNLGIIMLLFPKAKLIHIVRDPLDTCLSCYNKFFQSEHSYANRLDTLGQYHVAYMALMEHWKSVLSDRIFTLRYENLVTNTDTECARLAEYLGLDWSEDALTEAYSANSESYDAGGDIGPINQSFVGHSGHYRKFLQPLIEALGNTGPRN